MHSTLCYYYQECLYKRICKVPHLDSLHEPRDVVRVRERVVLRLAVDDDRQHRRLQDELLRAERLRDGLERGRGGRQAHRRQRLDTEILSQNVLTRCIV